MANEYLKKKWRMWFGVFDGHHKHRLSHADMTENENRFAILSHLDDEHKKKVIETIDTLVNENVFYGKQGPISVEEFVDLQNEDFKADKDSYIAKRRNYFTELFETMNLSGKGITEEEFVNILRAAGHENIVLDKQFFQFYNPQDGIVPLRTLIDSWIQFTTCEDSSKPDIVKAGIATGI